MLLYNLAAQNYGSCNSICVHTKSINWCLFKHQSKKGKKKEEDRNCWIKYQNFTAIPRQQYYWKKVLHFPPHEGTWFYKIKNCKDGEKVCAIETELDLDKQGKQKLTCKLGPFLNYMVFNPKISVAFSLLNTTFFSALHC